ncbi:MAG: hypothetical protein HON94_12065 [Methylococcales bacterium]|jgi:hypothetical protein|nr:hypothetical protein [Methylococcales bacterium]MBT7410813.1 hypothetical protein [Methylococcales bacterium]
MDQYTIPIKKPNQTITFGWLLLGIFALVASGLFSIIIGFVSYATNQNNFQDN